MKRLPGLVLLLICSSVLLAAHAQGTPKNGGEVIRAMHDAYAKSWYKTLTFVQKTTNYKPDGTSEISTWYESLSAPGRLRIDIEPIKDGNGILFVNDKQIGIKDGKIANSRERIHPLLLLGFDVYVQPVETTIQKLEKLNFDLGILHEDKWQGEAVYVVGAKAGDNHTAQFWVTKKNLLFVRLIQPGGKDGKLTTETQFNKYEKAKGGGWVSAEVIFMVDGKRVTTEEYTDIKVNVPLDDSLFDPAQWITPKKIGEGGKGKAARWRANAFADF